MPAKTSHIQSWIQLQKGNKQALLEIYTQHYIGLMNYGIKLTGRRDMTRDCITQILLRLWDNRSKLPCIENVRSYLLTSLRRELIAEIKMEGNRSLKNRLFGESIQTTEAPYEEYIVQLQHNRELKEKLMNAIGQLTQREKELLKLKFFEDLDYDEIAAKCNITKRTAYNIIHQALKSLRLILVSTPPGNLIPDYALLGYLFFFFLPQ
ncbi:MAG TPA: sigma-70 family RNA polymerase sigma factor [Agriterribacter sp.]|nr:sigma-70 family RNA polymerase sigma factor [Agriterribacter sp.]HRQ16777.1 sigma-70 family RNA polymerase sigma factor [Agriterribacter sp.]